MQFGLQFFDIPVNGPGAGQIQKIAVKTSELNTAMSANDDGFMAVMDTLMALSPEQLETSLKQLEWIPVEEGGEAFAPVIDLTGLNGGSDTAGNAESVIELLASHGKNDGPLMSISEGEAAVPQSASPTISALDSAEADKALFFCEKATPALQRPLDGFKNNKLPFEPDSHSVSDKIGASQTGNAKSFAENHMTDVRQDGSIPHAKFHYAFAEKASKGVEALGVKGVGALGVKGVEALGVKGEGIPKVPSSEVNTSLSEPTVSDGLTKQGAALTSEKKATPHDKLSSSSRFNSQMASNEIDPRKIDDTPLRKAANNEKPTPPIKAEQFRAVSDSLVNGSDKGMNSINQMNEVSLKEATRQNAKSESVRMDFKNPEIKPDQVQPNSSAKDASLSFSSRWGAAMENRVEMVAESKSMDAAPEKTDQTDVIRQIVQRMTLKSGRLQSQMNIKLKPEFLGNIRMQITSDNHQVAVRMVADSNVVKEMIEQNIQYLKAELQQHGLEIDKFDVLVGNDNDDLRQEQQAQLRQRSRQKGEALKQGNKQAEDGEDNEPNGAPPAPRTSTSESEIDYFV